MKIKKTIALVIAVIFVSMIGVFAVSASGKSNVDTAAQVTGKTKQEIKVALKSGKTLKTIIEESGKLEEFNTATAESIKSRLDKGVENGKITQAQADTLYAKVQSEIADGTILSQPFGFCNEKGNGMKVELLDIAAQVTGLTKDDIMTQIKAGTTLKDIIDKSGKLEDFKTAILASLKTNLDQQVAAGKITQAQADTKYADAQTAIAEGKIFNMSNNMRGEKGPRGEQKGDKKGLGRGYKGDSKAPATNASPVTNA